MRRSHRLSRPIVAFGLTIGWSFGAEACTAQKTESSAGKDSPAATVPLPVPASAEVAPPVSPPTSATVKDSGKAHKTPIAGGERDSAVQAVFEIGPDGKVRRVKR